MKLKEQTHDDSGVDIVFPSELNPEGRRNITTRLDQGWALVTAPPNAEIHWDADTSITIEYRIADETKWIGKLSTDQQPIFWSYHRRLG